MRPILRASTTTICDDRSRAKGRRRITLLNAAGLLQRWLEAVPALILAFAPLATATAETGAPSPIDGEATSTGDLAHWRDSLVGPRLNGADRTDTPFHPSVTVATIEDLLSALHAAVPGTVIEIAPGRYDFTGGKIEINSPGLPHNRIVLRAPALGSVRLRFALLEGFHVQAPYWTFENLVVEGSCADDSDCEHAFHVVGDAVGVTIQNNWVVDFNAAVKVNGKDGRYPDDGLISRNAFINTRPRVTDRPVTMLDLVSVSRWRIQRNLIADFAKAGGNHTSYGAFFKGAGEGNVFEQNLVRCEAHHSGLYRIGFSFGDGGTGRRFCRDGSCVAEHRRGVARNNVIMNCPHGPGIYLNKSAQTLLHNNALIDTGGIVLSGKTTHAVVLNNILDGGLWARAGGKYFAAKNLVTLPGAAPANDYGGRIYFDVGKGDLRLRNRDAIVARGVPVGGEWPDLCGHIHNRDAPDIGPIQYGAVTDCVPRLW